MNNPHLPNGLLEEIEVIFNGALEQERLRVKCPDRAKALIKQKMGVETGKTYLPEFERIIEFDSLSYMYVCEFDKLKSLFKKYKLPLHLL